MCINSAARTCPWVTQLFVESFSLCSWFLPPALQARACSRLIRPTLSLLAVFFNPLFFHLPKVPGEQRDHCVAKRPVMLVDFGVCCMHTCVWNPQLSALSVSLSSTTLAGAVPCACFDGECRGAPISVSGCNYSLEGPHLAVGSRQRENERARERGMTEKTDMKNRRCERWRKNINKKL